MKFHLLSDLHLEFAPMVELPGGEVLLLAGDIAVADYMRPERTDKEARMLMKRYDAFFKNECLKYKKIFYIMGNHDHYQGNWDFTQDILREYFKDTIVQFIEKQSVDLGDDILLWGATFWTDMDKRNPIIEHHARMGMNDYHIIGKGVAHPYGRDATLHPQDTILDHELALSNLKYFLKENPDKKIVIMTHMAPTSKSCHPRYGANNPLNFCYFSDQSNLILDNQQIKVWVHGHTHHSHDYIIGETRVLCNPRGYANSIKPLICENIEFNINQVFEV